MNLFATLAFRRRTLPTASDGLFTFSVPEHLQEKIEAGQIVLAPIREESERGVIIHLSTKEPGFETREILEICTPPLLSAETLSLASSIATEYLCPLSKIIPLFLPEKIFSGNGIVPGETWVQKIANPEKKVGEKMSAALDFLEKNGEVLRGDFPYDTATLNRLLKCNAIAFAEREKKHVIPKKAEIPLNEEQKKIFENILSIPISLLFGKTGSGKSHLLRALTQKITQGKKTVVFLVPEIGLTDEVLEKFTELFDTEAICVFQSRLSEGEKARAFGAAKNREKLIFVVSRAGLFLPLRNIGLLAVEEEHESSFESEMTPKYDARRVTEMIGKIHNAPIIFSSASPRVEQFFLAEKGKIGFFELSSRTPPVPIRIIDLKEETVSKNFSPISRALFAAMQKTLAQKQKIFLFLNRRGLHRVVLCEDCGEILRNPRNGVALVAHEKNGKIFLLCHHSGAIFKMPNRCPHCGGTRLLNRGYGTAGIEALVHQYFPQEKIIRIDRDATQRKGSFSALKKEFSEGDANILIGTQIVAKGLDFENIGLVGILDADAGLQIPDFRATERAFQNLIQVAGRAGRRGQNAEIIVQTRLPDYPLFSFLQENNFRGFYEEEIKIRESFFLPPFSRISTLSFRGKNREKVFERARIEEKKWRDYLERKHPNEKWEVSVSPALFANKNGWFEVEARIIREN